MPDAIRFIAPFAIVLAAYGCDSAKPRDPVPPLPVGEHASRPLADRLPAWSRDFVGKPLAAAFPETTTICVGNTDAIRSRFPEPAAGVEIIGWGWDPTAKAAIPRILVVDSAGVVVGAGEPGIPRPDVTSARADVTSPDTGWSALTERTRGTVDIYGITDGGMALCRNGRIDLG